MGKWVCVTPRKWEKDEHGTFVLTNKAEVQRLVNLDTAVIVKPYIDSAEECGSEIFFQDDSSLLVKEDIGVFERILLK